MLSNRPPCNVYKKNAVIDILTWVEGKHSWPYRESPCAHNNLLLSAVKKSTMHSTMQEHLRAYHMHERQ